MSEFVTQFKTPYKTLCNTETQIEEKQNNEFITKYNVRQERVYIVGNDKISGKKFKSRLVR